MVLKGYPIVKRALRRHHKQRMIRRALKSQRLKNVDSTHRSEVARRWADHLKICSCVYSCGNVRHNPWSSGSTKRTLQEHKSLASMKEQVKNLESMDLEVSQYL